MMVCTDHDWVGFFEFEDCCGWELTLGVLRLAPEEGLL